MTLPSERGGYLNCFALIARDNRCFAHTTEGKVTADWVAERIDEFIKTIKGLTVIVLDNARVHIKAVKDHAARWQEKGLYVLFLPTYSPHLNIAEILWRQLKYRWLRACDYATKDTLHKAVRSCLSEVGKSLNIAFQPVKMV